MKEFILQYDLSIYSFWLLAIVLVIIFIKKDFRSLENRIFRGIIYLTMLVIVFEILSWMWDGKSGDGAFILNYTFNMFFSTIPTIVTCLWASYIDFKIFGDKKRIYRRKFYLYPAILVILLTILNFFIPVTFSIDAQNFYHREPFMWLSYFFNVALYVYFIVLLFNNRKITKKVVWFGFIAVITIPALGAGIQMMYYGLMLIGASQALTVLILYIVLETTSNKSDYLTGLSTRSVTDEYILRLISKDEIFFVLMLDLDDFKKINDQYGHNEGDKTLIFFADVLKSIFKTNSVIARYGGDEFIVVQKNPTNYDLEKIKDRIYAQFDLMSENVNLKESPKFSLGLCLYEPGMTLEDMLVKSDNEMYLDKANNKNKRRRKDDRQ